MSDLSQLELDFFTPLALSKAEPFSPPPTAFRWPNDPDFERTPPNVKLADNLAALKLLRQLIQEGRKATFQEQQVLARYNGWGGLSLVFEPNPRQWAQEAEELKTLLSPTDYASARSTVNTAFFTPHYIAFQIFQALQRFGFHGGKILEPSAGIGVFPASQPPFLTCDWTAVEIDTISGQILEQLQPNAGVQICGLQHAILQDGYFDAVIGNVPFGDYPIHDRRLSSPLVHDFFLLRAAELVRPGGVIAVISSRGTLDKTNPRIRETLAVNCELIGAIRLPDCAFSTRALTKVTTDIIFLQRRLPNTKPHRENAWIKTVPFETANGNVTINEYFAANPSMILGRMVPNTGRFGEPSCRLDKPETLPNHLSKTILTLPEGCYRADTRVAQSTEEHSGAPNFELLKTTKELGYAEMPDGTIAQRRGNHLAPLKDLSKKRTERIKHLLRVRNAARSYLDAQAISAKDEEIENSRLVLNQVYDQFVEQQGPITLRANQMALDDDPDLPFLLALEDFDATTQKAQKAPFFFQRTLEPVSPIEHAENAADALLYSLRERGEVDLPYMATLTGKSTEDIITELSGRIYFNPETSRWETADEYLSGNVVHKLRYATGLRRPELAPNILALEAVQPQPLGPGEIKVRLGATWVPTDTIKNFVEDILCRAV